VDDDWRAAERLAELLDADGGFSLLGFRKSNKGVAVPLLRIDLAASPGLARLGGIQRVFEATLGS
jgi:hypothetical protein